MSRVLLEAPPITTVGLWLLLIPVVVVWWVLRSASVGNEGRFIHAAVRGAVQLSIVGYVLVPLFDVEHDALVLLAMCGLCCLAAFFSLGVLGRGPGLGLWPLAVAAILPVVVGLTVFALGAVVGGVGTFEPRYAITLSGMLAGNAMNATALAGERFLTGLTERRSEIEDRLLSGLRGRAAVAPQVAAALRAAVTPSVNSMFAVGLVSFPGMMTGQIMAGEDPLPAAFWQMMIMALWTCAATLAPRVFLHLLAGRMLRDHRIQEELAPGRGPAFRVETYAPDAVGPPPVFRERPPESMTRGFIDDAPEQ